MAADLHIHIRTPEVTEEDMNIFFANHIGHSRCNIGYKSDQWGDVCVKLRETPDVHVGEVSWLKAALFEDEETFVPSAVQAVAMAIGEEVTIDEALIAKIEEAFKKPNTTQYDLATADVVIRFLEEHKGKRCFTISW